MGDAIDSCAGGRRRGQIRAFTGNEYIQDLTAGNIVACEAWSGDVIQAQFDNPDIKFVAPEEGLSLWSDNMMVPNLPTHQANAEKWIDYYYEPEVAAKLAAWVNYICPVEGAQEEMEKIDPSLVENQLIFPDESDLDETLDFMPLDDQSGRSTRGSGPMSRWLSRRRRGRGRAGDGLELRSLTKDVRAFTAVDDARPRHPRGAFFALLGPRAAARRPRCGWSPAWRRRPRHHHPRPARTSPAPSPTGVRSTPSSRATRCSRTSTSPRTSPSGCGAARAGRRPAGRARCSSWSS